jgi:hypothetical protein
LDATTNNALSWNPAGASALVRALAISGSTLYVGGDFSVRDGGVGQDDENNEYLIDPNFQTIGGSTRSYLAALNTSDGTVTSWNPNAGNGVYALAVNAGIVYAGGTFTTIGPAGNNVGRTRIAALDATTGITHRLESGSK